MKAQPTIKAVLPRRCFVLVCENSIEYLCERMNAIRNKMKIISYDV